MHCIVSKILSPGSSLTLLAKTNAPCSTVSLNSPVQVVGELVPRYVGNGKLERPVEIGCIQGPAASAGLEEKM